MDAVRQANNHTTVLNNGLVIPLIGLGTYKLDETEKNIESAIKIGYRLFDTAKLYNNEVEVGKAINKSINEGIVKREEIIVITKLWNDDHDDPVTALNESLQRLNLDYVDIYLIHWSIGRVENGELVKQCPLYKTWEKMELCVSKGLTKSIGVCNFNVQLLLDLLSYCRIKPVMNEVELHPYLTQNDLVDFCKRFGIVVSAYNPIVRGGYVQRKKELFGLYDLFKNSTILELAEKYKKFPAQIVLNWHFYRGICAIPKSSDTSRQLQNFSSLDFQMEVEDYNKISNLNENLRFNPSKEKSFAAGIELFA